MADHIKLLTPDDIEKVSKLISEYRKVSELKRLGDAGRPAPESVVRVQMVANGGWRDLARLTYDEYVEAFRTRNEARAAIIRDQLLEYGVTVEGKDATA